MIVCCRCHQQMRPAKNSVDVVEVTETEKPYKLWESDKWECQGCGIEVLFINDQCGQRPVREHYQPDFEQRIEGVEYRAKQWSR